MAEGTRGDHWIDFWMCGTETGQQVAQLHLMMMMIKTSQNKIKQLKMSCFTCTFLHLDCSNAVYKHRSKKYICNCLRLITVFNTISKFLYSLLYISGILYLLHYLCVLAYNSWVLTPKTAFSDTSPFAIL
jgi:hypothetical protein